MGGKGKSCYKVVFLAIVNMVDAAQQIGWVGCGKDVAHWLAAGCHTHTPIYIFSLNTHANINAPFLLEYSKQVLKGTE